MLSERRLKPLKGYAAILFSKMPLLSLPCCIKGESTAAFFL